MKEILDSMGKWFKEKTTSPLYGTYIISVILWNWKFFYILFWQSEEKLLIPKIEYVQQSVLNTQTGWVHAIYFLILPTVSTYIIVWWLPVISNWAHKKSLEFYFKRKTIFDKERISYEEKQRTDLKSLSVIKKGQAEAKMEIIKNTSQDDLWLDDFNNFKKSPIFKKFIQLKNTVYEKEGRVSGWNGNRDIRNIDSDMLGIADSKKLITISKENGGEYIALTDKGKFFMSKFLEDFYGAELF